MFSNVFDWFQIILTRWQGYEKAMVLAAGGAAAAAAVSAAAREAERSQPQWKLVKPTVCHIRLMEENPAPPGM